MTAPTYRVYAIRYAYRDARRQEHFYGSIDRPDEPMPISYFVWLIVDDDTAIVVDTGFTAEEAQRRGRTYVMAPRDAVRAFGVAPESVGTVVLTHLPYDHAGCAPAFTGGVLRAPGAGDGVLDWVACLRGARRFAGFAGDMHDRPQRRELGVRTLVQRRGRACR